MITKAIVERIVTPHSARIRIPVFNRAAYASLSTPEEELSIATICSLPSSLPNLQPGDVVFVGFEDNDISKPIILGHLSREHTSSTKIDLALKSLSVDVNVTLPLETTVGKVTSTELQCLSKVKGSIQGQIDVLLDRIKVLEDYISNMNP